MAPTTNQHMSGWMESCHQLCVEFLQVNIIICCCNLIQKWDGYYTFNDVGFRDDK